MLLDVVDYEREFNLPSTHQATVCVKCFTVLVY